jgi:hypothetical protein
VGWSSDICFHLYQCACRTWNLTNMDLYICFHTNLLSLISNILKVTDTTWKFHVKRLILLNITTFVGMVIITLSHIYGSVHDLWMGYGLRTGFIAHLYNLLLHFTTIWHTVSSLLHHLRLPSQETPSISLQAAWDSHYIALGQPQQKTPFPNYSSTVIEVCLPRQWIQMVVLLVF